MLSDDERLRTKAQLRDWIRYERERYGITKHPVWQEMLSLKERALLSKHNVLLRKTEYYLNTNHKIIGNFYRIKLVRMQHKYALHIPLNTCKKGLKIMHIGPVLLNGNVTVGENCSLHINTALVAGGGGGGFPTLSDNIVVGVGAVIVGNIFLAENIAVGANAVVNKSFTEEDITIAGVPAKKISNGGRTKWNKTSEKGSEKNESGE